MQTDPLLADAPTDGSDDAPACGLRPGDDRVSHVWLGAVGPHPTVLTAASVTLIAAIFAHVVLPLPAWWPFAAGALALAANIGLAWWQAGSYRVVAVTDEGIKVLRKARWSNRCTHVVGTMPRMPLGPLTGRWCRTSVANSLLWVHRRHHPVVAAFDTGYRAAQSRAAHPTARAVASRALD